MDRTDYISRLILGGRPYLIDDTNAHTFTDAYAIVILEDTVISALALEGTSVLAEYNLSGKTLSAVFPPIIATPDGYDRVRRFTTITLTSGSVCVLRKNK